MKHQAKHFFYATGWKKFEPLWDVVIRARQLRRMTPLLEGVLSRVTGQAVPGAPVTGVTGTGSAATSMTVPDRSQASRTAAAIRRHVSSVAP